MVTPEAVTVTNSGLNPAENKPVIRFELDNHYFRKTLLPQIGSGELILIVQAVQAKKIALKNPETDPEVILELSNIRIPHSSDFMHHSRGLTIALYKAIQINYLVARLNDPGN